MNTTIHRLGCAALASVLNAACADNLQVQPANLRPVAIAGVVGSDTATPRFDYDGRKLAVKLDGSRSRDPDGKIATYRWLSGTLASKAGMQLNAGASAGMSTGASAGGSAANGGGAGARSSAPVRWVPEGEPASWPGDTEQPEVMLDEGVYSFTLWVIDERGQISDPSTVTITVSRPQP